MFAQGVRTRAAIPAALRGVTLLALCMLTAQAPAPGPTTLPEIGRTHSKGFCSTVRDNVAPSVLGLMKTDELIGASHRALLKMAHDNGSPRELELDQVYAGKVVLSMAHNLGVIKKLLADEKRFPKTPATDDDRFALLLKAQLQAAAAKQNIALNHVNGILEAKAMGQMRSDISTQAASSVAIENKPHTEPGEDRFLGASSLPGSGPGGMFDHGMPLASTPGNTIWDKLAADVEVQQTRIAAAERTLTPTVVAAAAACRGEAPLPAPSATP
ncbi:MAG: hypothetical protein M3169_16685 [Candidatus Eremiobacteraeota bacterium]|nr:hypothetical protein [Candidatus Eremiobacteraeota bacterium]